MAELCMVRYLTGTTPFHWMNLGASSREMFLGDFLKSAFQCIFSNQGINF